jgi:microcompartment protein CcmL/EutN
MIWATYQASVRSWPSGLAKVGELVSSHIIARPHDDLLKAFVNTAAAAK